MFGQIALCGFHDPCERFKRIALYTQVQSNQVCLAVWQHRNRRRRAFKMAAMVKLGQRRLNSAVAAIDDKHLWLHPGNHFQRFGNLAHFFDFVMEDIRVLGAIGSNRRQQ